MDPLAIAGRGSVVAGKIQLVMDRVIDTAGDDPFPLDAGDADAPVWAAAHKIGGAIDRVDHPGDAGRPRFMAIFFAKDSVIRELSGNGGAQQHLDLAVSIADKIIAVFAGDFQFIQPLITVQSKGAAIAGKFWNEVDMWLDHVGRLAVMWKPQAHSWPRKKKEAISRRDVSGHGPGSCDRCDRGSVARGQEEWPSREEVPSRWAIQEAWQSEDATGMARTPAPRSGRRGRHSG